jgi:hypothetical protein
MDDYEFTFQTQSEAEAALVTLEACLAEFQLEPNPRKTLLHALPFELERQWASDLRHLSLSARPSDAELTRYFDRVFQLKLDFPFEQVIWYALVKLRTVGPKNWKLFQDLLYQCVFSEPGTFEHVCTVLATTLTKWKSRKLSRGIDEVIQGLIEKHAPLAHGSELVWALWAAIWFRRKIPTRVAKRLDGNEDSFVALLTLLAQSRGLIAKSVRFDNWRPKLDQAALYSQDWLLAYEADRQGWLPATPSRTYVDSDPNFGPLKAAGVTFLDLTLSLPSRLMTLSEESVRARKYG